MTERSRPSGLDGALDASLRRRFTPPAGLEARFTVPRRPRARGLGRWLQPGSALAAAAALALLLRTERSVPDERHPGAPRIARAPAAPVSVPADWPAIGPLVDPDHEPMESRPDLGVLYRTMAEAHLSDAVSACDEGDRLDERLERTYGPGARLEPGAAGRLHGPFASPEWPTGTILTGTIGGQTSVLIAESDEVLTCCTDIRVPEDSGLSVFTWRVGSVALTEITPLAEPHLIEQCFQ